MGGKKDRDRRRRIDKKGRWKRRRDKKRGGD
jgi:hypothetical protein